MKLLHLDTSILGDASASRQLGAAVVSAWQAAEPQVQVSYKDLTASPVLHLSGASLAATGTPESERDAAQQLEANHSSDALEAFLAADALVIGAPMYNFTIPSQLKAWIDRIAVAGKTFSYTENGPVGLAGGKRVVIVATSGGVHAGQPSGAAHVDYLKLLLGFLGITDIQVVTAEGLAYGPDARTAALQGAQTQIDALFSA
jgi:FMN-dependent NADH-azoreductase